MTITGAGDALREAANDVVLGRHHSDDFAYSLQKFNALADAVKELLKVKNDLFTAKYHETAARTDEEIAEAAAARQRLHEEIPDRLSAISKPARGEKAIYVEGITDFAYEPTSPAYSPTEPETPAQRWARETRRTKEALARVNGRVAELTAASAEASACKERARAAYSDAGDKLEELREAKAPAPKIAEAREQITSCFKRLQDEADRYSEISDRLAGAEHIQAQISRHLAYCKMMLSDTTETEGEGEGDGARKRKRDHEPDDEE